ncbi:hypothetical protein AGDE_03349 [Angomonas deanei]|nr:hypothetical protein AGDE_03349 [Angomonas deanei]|eukprot:EPY40579.1 hypothetical protein AGDE_03349 [Angomonas deanei]
MLSLSWGVGTEEKLFFKCSGCKRLLPSLHFPNVNAPKHTLLCVSCKKMCVGCGIRLPLDDFKRKDSYTCHRCEEKELVAKENVYFRFPVLKYRACPFSVDEMRKELKNEDSVSPKNKRTVQ